MGLTWRHHTLIQSLLSRGPLSESDFHSIFSGVTGKNPATHRQLFNDFLLKINKELGFVQFELRGCRNQYDGSVYYAVVNNVADEHSKLGTKYSVPQIAFYKTVIEAIVHDAATHGCITNIEALNLRLDNQVGSEDGQSRILPAWKNFSISQKEKTIKDLVEDQWLCSMPDGKIGLGIRSFLDLRSWLRSSGIPSCDVCNEAGVKAATCANEDCNVRIHDYCLKQKFSQRKVARVCPGCGTEWNLSSCDDEVEEEVETEAEQVQVRSADPASRNRLQSCKVEAVEAAQAQSQEPSGPSLRKRLRSCKTEAVAATEAGPSQPSAPSTSMRRTRRSVRM